MNILERRVLLLAACVLVHGLPSGAAASTDSTTAHVDSSRTITVPAILTRVRPRVPESAKRSRLDDSLVVSANVGTDGLVKATRIARSVPQLDSVAQVAVGSWLFEPSRDADGIAMSAWAKVTLRFANGRWAGVGWVDRPPRPKEPPGVVWLEPMGSRLEALDSLRPTMVVHVLVGGRWPRA